MAQNLPADNKTKNRYTNLNGAMLNLETMLNDDNFES